MFYCREEELKTMNRRYEKGRFECIVIYGRRRVGKTALINEFCKDKPTVYFSALSASSQKNWRHCPKQFTVVKIRIVPLRRPIRTMMMRWMKLQQWLRSRGWFL